MSERPIENMYELFIYPGREGDTVKARIDWGDGRRVYKQAKDFRELMLDCYAEIMALEGKPTLGFSGFGGPIC